MKSKIANFYNGSIVKVAGAAIFAIAATFIAGLASADISAGLVQLGVNFPLREPFNFAIVYGFFYLWQKLEANQEVNFCQTPIIFIGGIKAFIIGIIICLFVLIPPWAILTIGKQASLVVARNTLIDLPIIITTLVLPLIILVLHGLAEQFLMGFIAQETASRKFGFRAGIIIAAFVFCILQYLQGYRTIGFIFSSLSFGLILGILTYRFGLWAAASLHGIWAWTELALIPQFYTIKFKDNLIAGGTSDSYSSLVFALVCLAVAICLYFGLGLSKSFNYKASDDKI